MQIEMFYNRAHLRIFPQSMFAFSSFRKFLFALATLQFIGAVCMHIVFHIRKIEI